MTIGDGIACATMLVSIAAVLIARMWMLYRLELEQMRRNPPTTEAGR